MDRELTVSSELCPRSLDDFASPFRSNRLRLQIVGQRLPGELLIRHTLAAGSVDRRWVLVAAVESKRALQLAVGDLVRVAEELALLAYAHIADRDHLRIG